MNKKIVTFLELIAGNTEVSEWGLVRDEFQAVEFYNNFGFKPSEKPFIFVVTWVSSSLDNILSDPYYHYRCEQIDNDTLIIYWVEYKQR